MKQNTMSKPALALLITGLLLISFVPLVNRYFPLPDFVKGFLGGLGIALELIALIKSKRDKKSVNCSLQRASQD